MHYFFAVHVGLLLSSIITILKLRFINGSIIIIAHGLCSSGLFYLMNLYHSVTNNN